MITRPNWHPPTGTCERSEHADEDGRNGWPNPDPADLGQHPHRLHQHGRVAHRASSRPRRADHGEVRAAVRPARVQPRRRRRPATSPSTSPQPPRADHRPPSSAIEVSAAGMRRHNPPPRVSPGPAAFGGGADGAPRHPRLDPAGRRKAPPERATGRRRTRGTGAIRTTPAWSTERATRRWGRACWPFTARRGRIGRACTHRDLRS